jgi:hypothetical protein
LGDGADALLAGDGVPAAGPAAAALLRGEEVYLAHGTRLPMADLQMLRRWDAVSVLLVPVQVDGAVIGCLHADRRTTFAAPDAATLAYVRDAARALAEGMSRRRAAPAPPAAPPAAVQAKLDAVLRVLRGEPANVVAASAGVDLPTLEGWRAAFLAGAAARLAG